MSESSKIRLDEYDPVIDYHHLRFENRCLRASGDDFQNLFEAIMVRARPGEFERVRPYGKYGDRKCDGLIESEGIIFQVYSPDELKQAEVQRKIDEDLEGAVQHWSDILKKWVFVYNVKRGIAPDIKLMLQQKQQQYPDTEIDCWSNDYLWEIVRGLNLQRRCEILGAPPKWNLGKPKKNFHVPNPPSHLLERSTDLGVLKNLLLSSSSLPLGVTGSTSKVGLHGMGGIGKSVLAGMLARDEEVQAAFPDGVFWIPLGQEPILTLKQLNFAQMLGDGSLTFQDVQQGKIHLSQLLDNRQCLLILDDVWQVEHIAAFDVLSEQSKLLFTSRDSRIVKALSAIEYQVNLLSNDEALELLATCSGQAKEALPVEAHEVMQECGNLPLALSMIGAIANARTHRWDNLLHKLQNADLDKIRHQFPDYPYPDLLKTIQVSVDALEPEVKTRYLDFAVFPEDVTIPEVTLQMFWSSEGLNEHDTQNVIDMLVERSLAQRDENGSLSLHDLLSDYVRKQVCDLSALHGRLLDAYAIKCTQGWHTYSEKDDYFFKYLAYHLKSAGRMEELYTLLTASPAWMEAKFIVFNGHEEYIADLEFAISGFADPLDSQALLTLIKLQTLRRVVHHQVAPYEDEYIETLVWLGYEANALAYVRLRPNSYKKFSGLMQIYKVFQEKGEDRYYLLEEAYQVAKKITEEPKRVKALCMLAKTYSKTSLVDQTGAILQEAKDIIYRFKETDDIIHKVEACSRMCDLIAVLVNLKCSDEAYQLLQETISLSKNVDTRKEHYADYWRAITLSHVSSISFEAGFTEEAYIAALEAKNSVIQMERKISLLLEDKSRRIDMLRISQCEADIAHIIEDFEKEHEILEHEQLVVKACIADAFINISSLEEAIQMAEEMKDFSKNDGFMLIAPNLDKGDILISLAQALAKNKQFSEAERIVQSIPGVIQKLIALLDLALTLSIKGEKKRSEAILSNFENLDRLAENLEQQSEVLYKLSITLAAVGKLDKAKLVVHKITDTLFQIRAWNQVALALAKEKRLDEAYKVFREAEKLLKKTENFTKKPKSLNQIAEVLAKLGYRTEAKKILKMSKEFLSLIEYNSKFSSVEIDLLHLSESLIRSGFCDEALTLSESLAEHYRADVLTEVACAMAKAGYEEQATRIFSDAEKLIDKVEDDYWRTFSLVKLADALIELGCNDKAMLVFDKAEIAAYSIKDEILQTIPMQDLIESLSKAGYISKAERLARSIHGMQGTLAIVAEALIKVGDLPKALEIVNEIKSDNSQESYLIGIAIALAEENYFFEAQEIVDFLDNPDDKARLLMRLGVVFADKGLKNKATQAFITARRAAEQSEAFLLSDDTEVSDSFLSELASSLVKAMQFSEALNAFSLREGLDEFLYTLANWSSSFEKFETSFSVKVIREAVQVAGWISPVWQEVCELM